MTPGLRALQGSVTAKVVFIGVLILILLIPLGMIEGLVSERQFLYGTARDDIARAWGRPQTVGGPILVVPFSYTRYVVDETIVNAERRAITVKDELYVLPQELEIRGNADAEERRRGIYKIPVYTARLSATGRFPPVTLDSGEYHHSTPKPRPSRRRSPAAKPGVSAATS